MWIAKRTGILCLCLVAGMLVGDDANAGSGAVVYLADQDTLDVDELYRADLKTSDVARISEPLVAGGNVKGFEFSK